MEPIGIIPRFEKKLWNFASITDGLVPFGILQRVAKKLWNFAILTNNYTDRMVPVGIWPRVAKKLQSLSLSLTNIPMVGAHPEAQACQTAWLVSIVTNRFANGPKNLARFFKFLVRISINYRRKLLTEFNATTQKNILFNVPSLILSETL